MAVRPFRYEHRSQPLLSRAQFALRLASHAALAVLVVVGSLVVGVVGYRATEGFSWVDSLVNASMLLGGMGPVDPLRTIAGKLFASAFALYSGIVFLFAFGIVAAPVAHRILHRLHREDGRKHPAPAPDAPRGESD